MKKFPAILRNFPQLEFLSSSSRGNMPDYNHSAILQLSIRLASLCGYESAQGKT
jgi:hypothetical protein